MKKYLILLFTVLTSLLVSAQSDGSQLWLGKQYANSCQVISQLPNNATAKIAKQELENNWRGKNVELKIDKSLNLGEGYNIYARPAQQGDNIQYEATITASNPIGLLYGAYELIRLQNTDAYNTGSGNQQNFSKTIDETEKPQVGLRILNHWDNAKILSNIVPEDCMEVEISVNQTNILFEFDSYRLVCRMIEGRYPNYRAVIPQKQPNRAVLKKADIVSALKRVSVFCDSNSSLVVLKFDSSSLKIAAHDLDFSKSAEETISLQSGCDIEIGFKSSFLIEMVNSIPSEDIAITMSDPSKASIFTRCDEEVRSLTYLLMPLSINY